MRITNRFQVSTSGLRLDARLIWGMMVLLAAVAPAPACSVPVFRYALERWPADRYELILFYRGPLKPAERALVRRLEQTTANLAVLPINLGEQPEPSQADLWAAQKEASLPWLVLRLPRLAKKQEPVWAGPLNRVNADRVVDSPLRRKLAERLLQGESAVWVFVETGDPAKDAAAFELLEKNLKKQQQTLQLPELRENNPEDRIESGPGAPELKIAFSLLRLSRTDPAEAVLLPMLLSVEEDLKEFKQPMALPIFGRGRALYALVGKGINEGTIEDACKFVIGPCGCEVKRQNPGMDLLVSASWEATLKGWKTAREVLPPLPHLPPMTAVEEKPAPLVPAPPEPGGGLPRNVWIVLGIGLACVAVAAVVLLRTEKKH